MRTSYSGVIAAIWFASTISAAPVINTESTSLSRSPAKPSRALTLKIKQKHGSPVRQRIQFVYNRCVPTARHAILKLAAALQTLRSVSNRYAPTASRGIQRLANALLRNRKSVFNRCVPMVSRGIQSLVNAPLRSRKSVFNHCAPMVSRGIQSLVDARRISMKPEQSTKPGQLNHRKGSFARKTCVPTENRLIRRIVNVLLRGRESVSSHCVPMAGHEIQ